MVRLAALLLICLLMAACSDDEPSGPPPPIEDVAADLGCSRFDQVIERRKFTHEIGSCQIDRVDVYVYTFADADQQNTWIRFAPSERGDAFVEGDLWTAQTFDADIGDKIAAATDGTVVADDERTVDPTWSD